MIINIKQVFLLCKFDGNKYSDSSGEMQNFRYVTVSMVEHAAVNRKGISQWLNERVTLTEAFHQASENMVLR